MTIVLTTADRMAIHELIAQHGHLVDNGMLDRLGEVFTVDVRYDTSALGGGLLVGLDSLIDASRAMGERNPLAHPVTNTVVVVGEGGISATSKYLGLGVDGSTGSGTSFDSVVPTSVGWRIAARRIVPRRVPLQP